MSLDSLKDYLQRHELAFTTACESILRGPLPAGTAYGLFWFQIDDSTWEHLPIALIWCDHDHGCDAQYPSPLTRIPNERWSPSHDSDDTAIGEIVAGWVARCWNNAGGAESPVPFYCYNYHTSEQFCLRRTRYVTDEEITADIEEGS